MICENKQGNKLLYLVCYSIWNSVNKSLTLCDRLKPVKTTEKVPLGLRKWWPRPLNGGRNYSISSEVIVGTLKTDRLEEATFLHIYRVSRNIIYFPFFFSPFLSIKAKPIYLVPRLRTVYPDVSLSRWKFARKGRRKKGENGPDVTLPLIFLTPMVPFVSSPVTCVSLAFGTRIYAKNETPYLGGSGKPTVLPVLSFGYLC